MRSGEAAIAWRYARTGRPETPAENGTIRYGPASRPALDELTTMAREDPDPRTRQVVAEATRLIDVK